jgi:hypothetical protein
MEIAFIFAIGWVASHVFGEKRDEYAASQEGHRGKYLQKLRSDHPSWNHSRQEKYLRNATRRNALGHFAYLLRHGWSSTFNDFGDGWKKAKDAHEEWKSEHPKDKPGRWQMLKAGWADGDRQRKEAAAAAEREAQAIDTTPDPAPEPRWTAAPDVVPDRDREYDERMLAAKEASRRLMLESFPKIRDELTEDELTEHMRNRRRLESDITNLRQRLGKPDAGPWLTDEESRNARIYPWPNSTTETSGDSAGPTNGAPMTTQTATSGEAHNLEDVRRNSAALVQGLQQYRNQAEQLLADTMRFASNDREAIAILQQNIEGLDNVIAGFGRMPTVLNKHQTGEEYASTSHAVNDINALKTS